MRSIHGMTKTMTRLARAAAALAVLAATAAAPAAAQEERDVERQTREQTREQARQARERARVDREEARARRAAVDVEGLGRLGEQARALGAQVHAMRPQIEMMALDQVRVSAMQLAAEAPQLTAMAHQLASSDMQLQMQHAQMAVEMAPLGAMAALGPMMVHAAEMAELDESFSELRVGAMRPSSALRASPRPSWAPDDPADSLYKLGREAINRGEYDRAAVVFQRLRDRFPSSTYAADALYWQAFALYRGGDDSDLRSALSLLDQHRKSFANSATGDEARTLRTRVCGEMARRGDERCASEVSSQADPRNKAPAAPRGDPSEKVRSGGGTVRGSSGAGGGGCTTDEDDDMRIAALNALLQMDADQALPILREVLARRDGPCSDRLRKKAVFLVSQKNSPESADILMNVARSDPNEEIRSDAVF